MITITLTPGYREVSGADHKLAARYALAQLQPRYPVPAIREHFEFGWSLSNSEPVLMHVVYGSYEG